jgi:arabinofuranosyltransferase
MNSPDESPGLTDGRRERSRFGEAFVRFLSSRRTVIAAGLVILLAAIHLFSIGSFGRARIDGKRCFLVHDDIMISMQYGRNLARGNGLVFNPGERVEGFTNPLLTLAAGGLHLLPLSVTLLPLGLQVMNLLASAAVLLMIVFMSGRDAFGRAARVAAATLYVMLPNHVYFAHAGFEVYLLMTVLVFAVLRVERLGYVGAFVVGLLPLTHGTGLDPWLVLVAAILLMNRSTARKRLLLAGLAVLPFLAYETFRISYYHDVLPNTFWLKAGAAPAGAGFEYLRSWGWSVLLLSIPAFFALVLAPSPKTLLILVLIVVHVTAVFFLGGDVFPQHRFLFPCSVLLTVLAGRGLVALVRRFSRVNRLPLRYALFLVLGGVAGALVLVQPALGWPKAASRSEVEKAWNLLHFAMGRTICQQAPQNAKVALFGLGYTGYYSERRVIDMLGKIDPHIARVAPVDVRLAGHNKTDFDYVFRLRPDYVQCVYTPEELNNQAILNKDRGGVWGFAADLAKQEWFQRDYAPHPVLDAKGRFTGFYSRAPD